MKKSFTIILLLLMSFNIYSQKSTPLFRHFSPEDGLPSSQVYQVIQDKEGYLWFATDHGVARYNGYEYKTYTTANGLIDNTVLKIFLDYKGRIWMQTFSGLLFYFDKESIVAYQFNSVISKVTKNYLPLGFSVDSLENVYFSISNVGEFKINNEGNLSTVFKCNIIDPYSQIFLDVMEDNSCLVTSNTLTDIKRPSYLYYKNSGAAFDSMLIPAQVSGQLFARRVSSGRVLISISKSLFEFNNNHCRRIEELPSNINYIYEDKYNRIWLCTFQGLYLLENNQTPNLFTRYLDNEFVSCITQDHEGGYWISTVNNGVFYLSDDRIKSYVFSTDSLKEPLCLAAGRDVMYAGFWNGKLAQLNTSSIKIIYSGAAGSYISSLFYDVLHDRVYLGKDSSGYLENNSFVPFGGNVTRALKGNYIRRKNGELYNASVNGIYQVRNNNVALVSPLNQRTNCIFENERGGLIVGCNNGAFRFDEQTESCILIHEAFKNIRVDDISNFGSYLCFATRGTGLFMMRDNKIRKIDESDGLCSNIIHKLAVSKDAIWCASYNGISKISFSSSDSLIDIVNIGISDGLPNIEINDIAILNDTVWVASKTAISFFSTKTDFINAVPPLLQFTSFRINNNDTTIGQHYQLPYHSNSISIGFEALSFKSGGKINYKYLLINETDSLESTTTNRRVEFLSLKPGHYTLMVNAMNNSGIWSTRPVKLQFTILQPFWQRWWFQLLVLFFSGVLIYFLVRQRIARVRKQEKIKTDFNKQIVLLEMKALRSQMNPHFVFNVMNSIQDYILKSDAKSAQKYLTKFARLVRLILDNSVEGEVVLHDELKAASLYVELEQQRFDDNFEFTLQVDEQLEVEELLIPSMIIQPYLENSIKHGISHLDHKGKIALAITTRKDAVLISITDNGVGRAAAAEWNKMNVREHISHGSTITANRITAYNIAHNTHIQTAITDILDSTGAITGTRVEVVIPVKYKNV